MNGWAASPVDLLVRDKTPPLELPLPKDARARGMAERILADPKRSLGDPEPGCLRARRGR